MRASPATCAHEGWGSTIAVRERRSTIEPDANRFELPLYTYSEGARFLGVPTTTFANWAKGYVRQQAGRPPSIGGPIITSRPAKAGDPSIPFIGLAEAMVLAAFRRAGVSLQHIRAAVAKLEEEIHVEHALASRRVFTDGAVILFDYAGTTSDEKLAGLTEVVSQQKVFAPVIRQYLKRIEYANDGWATSIVSPATDREIVQIDPARGFGQPIFVHGAARVEDVIDRWRAGDSLTSVAADFGVPVADVEDVLRVAFPIAA